MELPVSRGSRDNLAVGVERERALQRDLCETVESIVLVEVRAIADGVAVQVVHKGDLGRGSTTLDRGELVQLILRIGRVGHREIGVTLAVEIPVTGEKPARRRAAIADPVAKSVQP